MSIQLAPEIEVGLRAEAAALGISVDALIAKAVNSYLRNAGMSDKAENRQAAAELKTAGRNAIIGDAKSFGITRVPTALRLDGDGKIESMWTGTVSPARESEVMEALLSGSALQKYSIIDEALVPKYARRAGTLVLSLSAANARKDLASKLIPAGELAMRARYELEPSRLIVVDCSTVTAARTCQESVLHLVRMRYHVLAAGLPRNSPSCRAGS